MFFQGTLQEGIAAALEQSKLVVCFVTDDGEESQLWEDEFLKDDSVKGELESGSIVLRLPAGTEEAGFFEAMFPVPRKPTIAVIQNGQLKEYIAGGTPKEEFLRRMCIGLGAPATQTQSVPSEPIEAATSTSAAEPSVGADEDDLYGDEEPASSRLAQQTSAEPSSAAAASSQSSEHVQALLAERAKRLEADKQAKEAQAKAEREARAKERQAASGTEHSNIKPAERGYAEELRKRKQQEVEERKRVLRLIEEDKKARKEKEAQERQARLLLNAQNDETSAAASTPTYELPVRPSSSAPADFCYLQVRLLDGSTIRNRFPSDVTLNNEVRKWVDEARTDGSGPYTFRVILTPLPNKSIEATEETESLRSLELAPSATLILVPVARYSTAFAPSNNVITQGFSSVIGLWASLFGALSFYLSMIIRGTRPVPAEDEAVPLQNLDSNSAQSTGASTGQDAEARRRRDQQFYNGNSLSFESRKDDEDQAKK